MVSAAQDSVRGAVEAYCRRYANSPPFAISELYDLERDWTEKDYPNAEHFGCYILLRL